MYSSEESTWEVRETPQYRLKTKGVAMLTDAEVLASVANISQKEARICLSHFLSLQSIARASFGELTQISGIDNKAAMSILCAFELGRKKQEEECKKHQIITSEHVATYFQTMLSDQSQEVFAVLFLNRQNQIIAEEILFKGGVTATIVDARLIFRSACSHLACSIILGHNHPSGSLVPSEADKKITQQIKKAGELLDVIVLDHLIITSQGYFSFADERIL